MTWVLPHSWRSWRPSWSITPVHLLPHLSFDESCIHLKSKSIPAFVILLRVDVPSSSSLPQSLILGHCLLMHGQTSRKALSLVTGETPCHCDTALWHCRDALCSHRSLEHSV